MQSLKRRSLIALSVMALTCLLAPAHAAVDEVKKDEAAAAPKKNRESCVFSRSVRDWRALDDTNLVVWAPNDQQAYHVKLALPLFSARFDWKLAFIDGDQDGRICSYGRDSIGESDRSPTGQRSSITSITRLDPESIAKLEEQYKTKLTPQSRKKQTPQAPESETAK
jgi:hypothetical protein